MELGLPDRLELGLELGFLLVDGLELGFEHGFLLLGMMHAWVGQKRLKRYILRRFFNRS